MKLSRREFGIGVSAAALATAYGRPGWAQSPGVIKYSHVVANDTLNGAIDGPYGARAGGLSRCWVRRLRAYGAHPPTHQPTNPHPKA